jgi:hypothetical protein
MREHIKQHSIERKVDGNVPRPGSLSPANEWIIHLHFPAIRKYPDGQGAKISRVEYKRMLSPNVGADGRFR